MVGWFQTNRRINPTIGRIKIQFVGLKSVYFIGYVKKTRVNYTIKPVSIF